MNDVVQTYILSRKLSQYASVAKIAELFSPSVRPGGGWKQFTLMDMLDEDTANVYQAQRLFYGETPMDRRVIYLPGKKQEDPLGGNRVVLTERSHIRKHERARSSLVIVHAPVRWDEVAQKYPAALIAGYAENADEEEYLRLASGVEGACVLRADKTTYTSPPLQMIVNNRGVQSVVHALEDNPVPGPLTASSLDKIVIEGIRRRLVRNIDSYNCEDKSTHNHCILLWIKDDMNLYDALQKNYIDSVDKNFDRGIMEFWEGSPLYESVGECVQSRHGLGALLMKSKLLKTSNADEHPLVGATAFRKGYEALISHYAATHGGKIPPGIRGECCEELYDGVYNVPLEEKKQESLILA